MTNARPILVDICWTLYRSNTTFDFLDWFVSDAGYKRLRRFFGLCPVRLLNLLMVRLTHYDLQRHLALRYIRHIPEKEIQAHANEFVNHVLASRRIEEAWETVQGRRVILASGTIPVIAQAVAQTIKAEKTFADSLFKEKVRKSIHEAYDILTDNLSDWPLVCGANHAYIVVYNNQNRWDKRFMQSPIPHTYIYVNENKY